MKSSRSLVVLTSFLVLSVIACSSVVQAHETGSQHLHFQKPGRGAQGARDDGANQKFRRPTANRVASKTESREKTTTAPRQLTRKQATTPVASRQRPAARPAKRERQVDLVQFEPELAVEAPIVEGPIVAGPIVAGPIVAGPIVAGPIVAGPIVGDDCPYCMGDCSCDVGEPCCDICEPGCGFAEPGCGLVEPGCGCVEPSCGCYEPACGMVDPGCGCAEPGCAAGVGCGSCVALPGPDYWCFPICLPRFKDLTVWAGVQGFRGPRDFRPQGRSDSNFGFHEGFNISGRAPLVGLLFPQLSYQLGYQAVQSRLDGTVMTSDDRSQQFVTGGLFRRVCTGLQFGVVWDMMRDDLDADIDLHQIRSEISIKTPRGREIGFWSTNSTNDSPVLGTFYETVDQYAFFYRWNYGNSHEWRLWGGVSGDGEGIFGGEFYAPLNDRWSIQSGFNYLIPDVSGAPAAVQQESWNIGINLVWHLGCTARRGCRSPFRPLFAVADNGWMFVDQAQ